MSTIENAARPIRRNRVPLNKAKYKDLINTIKVQEIKVFGPRVLILRDDPIAESAGGIIIPDTAQKKEPMGTIVLLGQGYAEASVKLFAEGVLIGDRLVTNQYDAKEFKIDTVDHGFVLCDVVHVGNLYLGYGKKKK